MLDSNYHMTLQLLANIILARKTQDFAIFYATLRWTLHLRIYDKFQNALSSHDVGLIRTILTSHVTFACNNMKRVTNAD